MRTPDVVDVGASASSLSDEEQGRHKKRKHASTREPKEKHNKHKHKSKSDGSQNHGKEKRGKEKRGKEKRGKGKDEKEKRSKERKKRKRSSSSSSSSSGEGGGEPPAKRVTVRAAPFILGERVLYLSGKTGEKVPAAIKAVHYDDEEPYYTITLSGGNERQTPAARLCAC
jgi:hypothetical protein